MQTTMNNDEANHKTKLVPILLTEYQQKHVILFFKVTSHEQSIPIQTIQDV